MAGSAPTPHHADQLGLEPTVSADATERTQIFKSVKTFYDTRSRLVHGAALKEKHHRALAMVHEMRGYVRTLLASFVDLAASDQPSYSKAFFAEQLDLVLQDEEARQRLRDDLGLGH